MNALLNPHKMLSDLIASSVREADLCLESDYDDSELTIEAGEYSLIVTHSTEVETGFECENYYSGGQDRERYTPVYEAAVTIESIDVTDKNGLTVISGADFDQEILWMIEAVIDAAACENQAQSDSDSWEDVRVNNYIARQECGA